MVMRSGPTNTTFFRLVSGTWTRLNKIWIRIVSFLSKCLQLRYRPFITEKKFTLRFYCGNRKQDNSKERWDETVKSCHHRDSVYSLLTSMTRKTDFFSAIQLSQSDFDNSAAIVRSLLGHCLHFYILHNSWGGCA